MPYVLEDLFSNSHPSRVVFVSSYHLSPLLPFHPILLFLFLGFLHLSFLPFLCVSRPCPFKDSRILAFLLVSPLSCLLRLSSIISPISCLPPFSPHTRVSLRAMMETHGGVVYVSRQKSFPRAVTSAIIAASAFTFMAALSCVILRFIFILCSFF